MKNLKKKLRSRAGETIAETLIGLLIAAIALTMLAKMITSTLQMVTASKEKMDAYYEAGEKLEIMDTEGSEATVTLEAEHLTVPPIPVLCFENTTFSGTDKAVYAYIINPSP